MRYDQNYGGYYRFEIYIEIIYLSVEINMIKPPFVGMCIKNVRADLL